MGPGVAIEAFAKLGLPLLLLSWLLFHWLFGDGAIDRATGRKELKASLKRNKKTLSNHGSRGVRMMYRRWARFGGGFYGLAGLWTFAAIELQDLIAYLFGDSFLAPLNGSIIDLLIAFLVNQLANSIEALFWFGYWPEGSESVLLWALVAYLGYWGGVELARRELTPRDVRRLFKIKSATGEVSDHENI